MKSYEASITTAQGREQNVANFHAKMNERLKYVHATIKDEASRGNDRVKFESGELEGQDVAYLREQGYRVERCSSDLIPDFSVKW